VTLGAVIEAPSHGWGSTAIVAGLAVGLTFVGLFLAWELHTSSPMLNLRFFKDRRFSAASGAITLTFFALFGTIFLLTQYLQIVLGYSTIKAGAVLLPQALVMLVFAPLSSVWVQRLGNKLVVAGGLFVVVSGLIWLATLTEHSGLISVVGIGVILGVGMANVMAPATDSIMGSLPRAKAGVGSAMNDTTRQAGGAIGVAVLGSLLASRYGTRITQQIGRNSALLVHVKDNVAEAKGYALTSLQHQSAEQARVLHAAYTSFMSGFHIAAVFASVVIFLTALGVLRWLPARARGEEPVEEIVSEPILLPAVD
jgi:Na+/melibiose symporter-like transporter